MADIPRRPDDKRIIALLSIYGADQANWPADERCDLSQLSANSSDIADALAKAQALDRVLDVNPAPELPVGAINRTMTKIARIEQADSTSILSFPHAGVAALNRRSLTNGALTGALMAASLLVGVFVGLSDISNQILPATGDVMTLLSGNGAEPFAGELTEELL